jgi:RNA binding exosome subunit
MLNKINTKIVDLVKELEAISENALDFETREGHIVANIKCYEWLDQDDVLEICKKNNYSEKVTRKILKEFNEDRLSNIQDHVNEMEVMYLKEKYEDSVDISDIDDIIKVHCLVHNYGYSKEEAVERNPNLKFYIGSYWDSALNYPSFEAYADFIKQRMPYDYEEFYKRKNIEFQCYQFGRSGGWFSICQEDSIETDILSNHFGYSFYDDLVGAEDDKDFNEAINLYLDKGETKKDLIRNLKGHKKDFEATVSNIQSIIDEIENSKKYYKEYLLEQLTSEVHDFVQTDLKDTNVTIRIDQDKVRTSLGVSVHLEEFKTAFKLLLPKIEALSKGDRLEVNKKVGNYTVEYIKKKKKDAIVKAGCHRFSFNQIKEVLC